MTNLILLFTILIVLTLVVERVIVFRKVIKFKNRILVNGTRGKSSVVKYIYAALNDELTFAKITGVVPTIYLPDGKTEIIKRRGGARVQEQIKMIYRASNLKVKNVVLECMSINPQLQNLESKFFKPTIYVITNIKQDHAEQMGKTIEEQALSICNAIPSNSIVITAEIKHLDLIKSVASIRNSKVFSVKADSNLNCPEGMHPINLAMALKVCELIGKNNNEITSRIINKFASEDIANIRLDNDNLFINTFAVNDVDTAKENLIAIKAKYPSKKIIILFNSRNDRPKRSLEFSQWLSTEENIDNVILIGNHIPRVLKEINRLRIRRDFVISSNGLSGDFNDYLKRNRLTNSIFIGVGNIAGEGFNFLYTLQGRDIN